MSQSLNNSFDSFIENMFPKNDFQQQNGNINNDTITGQNSIDPYHGKKFLKILF